MRGRQFGDMNAKEKLFQLETTIQFVRKIARWERKQALRAVKLRSTTIREMLVSRIVMSYTIAEREN